jgi:hypothetical protein
MGCFEVEGAMDDLDILNCAASGKVVFEFRCPVQWASMAETGDPRKRHCEGCNRDVFMCHDANEAGLRAEQDECIAVPGWLAEGVRDHPSVKARHVVIAGRSATIRPSVLTEVVAARIDSQREP